MRIQTSTRNAAIAVSSAALGLTLLAVPASAAPAGSGDLRAVSASPAGRSGHRPVPVPLPDGFRPEGITSGPGDTYYAGSMVDGRIWTGDLSRGTGRQLTAGVTGRALRGMQWDQRSDLLWVTGQDASTGIVLAVDARTGTIEQRIVVPGAAFLNDVVITKNAVWVTDSGVDALTRIPLRRHGELAGPLTQVTLGAPWPTPAGNRANGIRELPDGSLIIDNSTAGGLWRVDPRTGTVSEIPVTGAPAGAGIIGGDGLERRGDTLYVVRGSSNTEIPVLRLRKGRDGWSAAWKNVLTSPDLDVPSTATLVGKTLWAVNARFGVADPTTASYQIIPLDTSSRG